jgi:HD-like signal output (HDOD) protein
VKLESLINHPSKLPTVPQVAQRVIDSFSSEDVTIAEIAELIEADPVLSAKLLRLANSSYFQAARSIESVEDAIRILGLAMVRHLVLAGGLMGTFVKVPGIDLHQFWTYSLYSACTARWLADRIKVNRDLPFTLGLMHGIGQLQMHHAAPAAAAALDQHVHVLSAERVDMETQALGFDFLKVSAALSRLWNFPLSLVEPLEQIANPLGASLFSSVAAIVHLSAWHARNTVLATPAAQARALYPEAVAQRLGLCAQWVFADTPTPLGEKQPTIPALHELTHGLDEILS